MPCICRKCEWRLALSFACHTYTSIQVFIQYVHEKGPLQRNGASQRCFTTGLLQHTVEVGTVVNQLFLKFCDICMIQEFLREQLNLLDVDNDFFCQLVLAGWIVLSFYMVVLLVAALYCIENRLLLILHVLIVLLNDSVLCYLRILTLQKTFSYFNHTMVTSVAAGLHVNSTQLYYFNHIVATFLHCR